MIEETTINRPGRPKDTVKREEIVIAATELFMENGYELTSMEAVARRASVSKLTIYSHFADKSELFRAIIQYRSDKVCMPKSYEVEAQMPVEEALTKIAHKAAAIIFQPESLRLLRIIYAEVLHHPEAVQAYYEVGPRRARHAFTDLLKIFNEQGQLAVPDTGYAAEQFFSLLKGEKLQRTLMMMSPAPTAEELDKHIDETVALFLAYYRPIASKK